MDEEAATIYRLAGLLPSDDPPALATLCRKILGADVALSHAVERCSLRRQRGRWVLLAPADLPDAEARFAVALFVAEWWAKRAGVPPCCAPALAAAILCPRASFLRAVAVVGYDVPTLARAFGVTETLAHLRYGEVTGEPVFLCGETVIRARGDLSRWRGLRHATRVHFDGDPRVGLV